MDFGGEIKQKKNKKVTIYHEKRNEIATSVLNELTKKAKSKKEEFERRIIVSEDLGSKRYSSTRCSARTTKPNKDTSSRNTKKNSPTKQRNKTLISSYLIFNNKYNSAKKGKSEIQNSGSINPHKNPKERLSNLPLQREASKSLF